MAVVDFAGAHHSTLSCFDVALTCGSLLLAAHPLVLQFNTQLDILEDYLGLRGYK